MFLMLFGKPSRRKGTRKGSCSRIFSIRFLFWLDEINFFPWEFPGSVYTYIFACSESAASDWCWGGSRCLSCWTANGLRQSPSTEQTGSSFPHILPRLIIQTVPYSLCTSSLSNEWHFRLLSELLLLHLITQLLCWSGSESVFIEHGYFFSGFLCTH